MQTLWQTIWQGDVYISPQVAILISPSFKSKLIGISPDDHIMDVSIEHPKFSTISIRNIYAPAHENRHRSFWASIPPLPPNTMIVGGDFNCILRSIDHISSTNFIRPFHPELFQRHFPSLIDLAATTAHPKFTCYTNHSNSWSCSRIDYVLLHPKLINPTHRSYTIYLPNDSDHQAVITTFSKQQHTKTWRLNSSLLQNPHTTQIINNILSTYSDMQFPHHWDDCKDAIQSFLQSMGRPAARCRKEGIKNLTNRLNKLQNINPPTQQNCSYTDQTQISPRCPSQIHCYLISGTMG